MTAGATAVDAAAAEGSLSEAQVKRHSVALAYVCRKYVGPRAIRYVSNNI